MTAEAGHDPNRHYFDADGDFHLNGSSFFNDAEQDIESQLESLAGVSADQLAALAGVSAAELGQASALPGVGSTIGLSAGGGVTQTATITLKDADGNALTGVRTIVVFMATDAAGGAPSTAGAQVSATATTGAVLKAHTAKLHWTIVTDANGVAVLTFDNTGGGGAYTDRVVLVLPTGKHVVSAALNVATA